MAIKPFHSDPSRNVDKECKNVSKCPEKCKCSHGKKCLVWFCIYMDDTLFTGVVDCRNLGLTEIPEDIPFETFEL